MPYSTLCYNQAMSKLILITNPGSASRKYALYDHETFMASLHFEYENGAVACTLKDASGEKKSIPVKIDDLSQTVSCLGDILRSEGYINEKNTLSAIVARVAAPSDYLAENHIVDDEFMKNLEIAKHRAILHVPVVASEIEHFRAKFPETTIVSISDSAFHWQKPDLMKYYAFDTEVADKYGIKRYGYHGLSVASVVDAMQENDILPEKLVVAHIGSGSSVSAVLDGRAMDNSMGYTPLEGLMMSTRAGSMDVAAALAIKRELKLDDVELEIYLNKKSGLLGTSGVSDDMRVIIQKRDEGDPKATFAHALYVHRIQTTIGQMAATLGGIDGLVFTATIGERSAEIRHFVAQKLAYLGLFLDDELNENPVFNGRYALISRSDSKPIYIIQTDETAEMVKQALALLRNQE